jgi:hypothetical protein
MLFIALLIVVACYAALYLMYSVVQPLLQGPTATLMWVRDLFFTVPAPSVMALTKHAIAFMLAYLVLDLAISSVKRLLSSKPRRASVKNLRTVTVRQGRTTSLVIATDDSLRRTI